MISTVLASFLCVIPPVRPGTTAASSAAGAAPSQLTDAELQQRRKDRCHHRDDSADRQIDPGRAHDEGYRNRDNQHRGCLSPDIEQIVGC